MSFRIGNFALFPGWSSPRTENILSWLTEPQWVVVRVTPQPTPPVPRVYVADGKGGRVEAVWNAEAGAYEVPPPGDADLLRAMGIEP